MTRKEMIQNCGKLSSCLETQCVSPSHCGLVGNCSKCPYDISASEAAVSTRALLNEIVDRDNKIVRVTIR